MFTQYSHDQSGDLTYEDFLLMLSQCSIESALFTGLLGFAEGALALTPTLILTPTLTLTITLTLTLTLTLTWNGAASAEARSRPRCCSPTPPL